MSQENVEVVRRAFAYEVSAAVTAPRRRPTSRRSSRWTDRGGAVRWPGLDPSDNFGRLGERLGDFEATS